MQNTKNTLFLGDYTVSKHQITFNYGFNDLRFNCSYWFHTIDILSLRDQYGHDFFENIIFHAMCFEANKLCSLKPDYFELRKFEKYYTKEFEEIWLTIFKNVWGQWRYQNNFSEYEGPKIVVNNKEIAQSKVEPVFLEKGDVPGLYFCGGGKDSLATMIILEKMKMEYDALVYTNTIYGLSSKQHKIIKPLLERSKANKFLTQYVFDDFLDSPVLTLNGQEIPNIKELIAAETPSSIFASLFWVLANKYSYIVLGHERSADFGNLIWAEKNEEINHQWGKSTEAENLISEYIRKHLIKNVTYFSALKPLYDTGIFQVVSLRKEDVILTHSCNIDKPWCCKCAKCAYVWLCFMAYLPIDIINDMFKSKNLLDDPDNLIWFKQLLGLDIHTPFECVGKKEEVRLAFELIRRKGVTGLCMEELFEKQVKDVDFRKIVEEHFVVDESVCNYPPECKKELLLFLKELVMGKKMEVLSILDS